MFLFAKLFQWIKKKWLYFVAGFAALFSVMFLMRRGVTTPDLIKDLDKTRKKEDDRVDAARENERESLQKIDEEFDKLVDDIENNHQKETENLEQEKKKSAETILEKHGDDPSALAKELSRVTGSKIVEP